MERTLLFVNYILVITVNDFTKKSAHFKFVFVLSF